MDVRLSSFNFPRTEDTGPQSARAQLSFARAVRQVAVGLTGWSATFEKREDHHLGFLTVELDASVNGDDDTKVDVSGVFGLRDWSGDWDDPYSGIVEFAVFAELEPAAPPAPGAPRGDLVVVDAEVTQAIQHFRSHRHLDSPNVFPDNSVRLVADKPTAVRLYVDFDASSGLAPIARLSGELRVTQGGSTTVLAPLRSIVPRRDAGIDRGQRDHTLNFVIPEALCHGTVDIAARVFSAADATQFSADFARTLGFETMPSLPVLAVGIEYTGPDVADASALSAPTMADFAALFGFTEATYPIPNVTISSYVTMTYDKEIKSDISEGCDKFNDLNDAVADMRGDSDDIVYGLYNSGVETGSVGGCGGSGVAVGRIGAQGTAAHEIGHALGREHAPCDNVTRCAEPLDTDDGYPRYASYDSDSIGEYGFDTRVADGSVLSPSTAHDMMGYSGGRWISPYTYKALMSRIPESFDAAGAAFSASELGAASRRTGEPRGSWIPVKQPHVFLRLDIARDRRARLQASFGFDARPRPHGHRRTDFHVEWVDEHGRVLRRACLHAESNGCGCGCGGFPVRVRQAVAFDARARELVLYECDKELQRWKVDEPPKVELDVGGHDDPKADRLELRWKIHAADGRARDCWALVQWRDARGTWRGAAPRTQADRLAVPKRLFKGARSAAVRVLACCELATGQAGWEGPMAAGDDGPRTPPPQFVPTEVDARGPGAHLLPGGRLRVAGIDPSGATMDGRTLRWYDGRGAEIGRGRTLDLGRVAPGQHQVTVVAPGHEGASATWLVERTRDGRVLLLIGDQKARISPRCPPGCVPAATPDAPRTKE